MPKSEIATALMPFASTEKLARGSPASPEICAVPETVPANPRSGTMVLAMVSGKALTSSAISRSCPALPVAVTRPEPTASSIPENETVSLATVSSAGCARLAASWPWVRRKLSSATRYPSAMGSSRPASARSVPALSEPLAENRVVSSLAVAVSETDWTLVPAATISAPLMDPSITGTPNRSAMVASALAEPIVISLNLTASREAVTSAFWASPSGLRMISALTVPLASASARAAAVSILGASRVSRPSIRPSAKRVRLPESAAPGASKLISDSRRRSALLSISLERVTRKPSSDAVPVSAPTSPSSLEMPSKPILALRRVRPSSAPSGTLMSAVSAMVPSAPWAVPVAVRRPDIWGSISARSASARSKVKSAVPVA